jgi:hypothetical protein
MMILEFVQRTEEECLLLYESIYDEAGNRFGIGGIIAEEKDRIERIRHLTYTTLAGFYVQ